MTSSCSLFDSSYEKGRALHGISGDSHVRKRFGAGVLVSSKGAFGIKDTTRSFECLNSCGAILLSADSAKGISDLDHT